MKYLVFALALLFISTNSAEARHRHHNYQHVTHRNVHHHRVHVAQHHHKAVHVTYGHRTARVQKVIDTGFCNIFTSCGTVFQSTPVSKAHHGRYTPRHLRHERVAYNSNTQIIPHPAGCPSRAFCGCGASIEAFGHSIRSLWLVANWYKFPRTYPAPGAAMIRPHHVAILKQHIQGDLWLVVDHNSGGHKSRIHVRSISGYTIVNPHI
jgi:hypothetical protein